MSRETEQGDQLSTLEAQFRGKLVSLLRRAAEGQVIGLFDSPRLSLAPPPPPPGSGMPQNDAQALEELGAQINRLRNKLDSPLDQGIFAQYLAFCSKWKAAGAPKTAEQRYAKEFLHALNL